MKFSILVPVYNVEKYLEQCVDSLLNQTYTSEYEIILVDDGSTDSSGEICDRYQKNNPEKIKVIHKKNQGLVSARQVGIELACGEYSFFVDSDDFVEPNLLESVENVLIENPDTDMIMYSFSYFENEKKLLRKISVWEDKEIFESNRKKKLYELLISTPYITSLWTKAIKTEILKNDPTNYSLYYEKNMAEDWFRSIHLLTAANNIVYINKPFYNYRTNETSISRSLGLETISNKNILYVYNRFLEYLPIWGINDEEHIQKLNARWLNEVMCTFSVYYENVSRSDRKAVLNFDWNSMLPVDAQTDSDNPYENKVYRKLYMLLNEKKYLRVRLFFIKKKTVKLLRKFLRKLLKRGR